MEPETTTPPAAGEKPRRRVLRRVLFAAAALLVALLVLIAFLPAILSSGFGKRRILGAAGGLVTAPVDAREMSFSWSGPQRIEGLRIGSPPGFPPGEDVLRVESISVEGGLLGLALSGSSVAIEVKDPVLRVTRSEKGEVNLESLPRRSPAEPDGRAPPGEKPPRGPSPPPRRERRPAFPRDVTLRLTGGKVIYRDAALGTASDVTDIHADLAGKADSMALRARVQVSHPEAASPGKAHIDLQASGLDESTSLETLVLDLDAGVESVDLRPYAGLIERFARARPPEDPLDWKITARSRAGAVELKTSASARKSLALDAKVTLSPPGPERTWTLDGSAEGDLAFLARAAPENAGVSAADGSRVRIGEAGFRGRVPPPGSDAKAIAGGIEGSCRLEQSGTVTIKGWKVGEASAALRASGGRFALEEMAAAVNGGRAAGAASVDMKAEVPGYSLSARLEDADASYEMTPLLQYVLPFLSLDGERAVFSGKVAGTIEVEGRGLDRASIEKDVNGKGTVRIRQGSLAASRFFSEIAGMLNADLGEMLFSEIGSDFAILPGRIDVVKAYFEGREGGKIRNLGLVGTTRFDGTIEYGVDAAALRETIGDKRIRRILEGIEKVAGTEVLPLKLAGTLASPKLALTAPSAGVIDRILGDGKGEGSEPGLDAEKAVDEVLDLFRKKERKKERKKPEK